MNVIEVNPSEVETETEAEPGLLHRTTTTVVDFSKKSAHVTKKIVIDKPVTIVGTFVDNRLSMHAAKKRFRQEAIATGRRLRAVNK